MASSSVQAIDFSKYLPPGVYTQAIQGPLLVVNSSQPTAVGLFGMTIGYRKFVESVLINPDTSLTTPAVNRTLSQPGINTDTLIVVNPNTGALYAEGTDYTVVQVGGSVIANTALYALSRVIDGGHIEPGDTVQTQYQYTPSDYFNPYIFYDYADVQAAYGAPFNTTTGQIQSELTLAAKFCFLNGAYQVVCVAVNPANPSSPTVLDYSNALDKLANQAQVAIVVPANGSMQPLQQLVDEHVNAQSANRYERRAILGLDGTTTPVPSSQRIIDAEELADQRVMLISPDTFTYYAPELNNSIQLGGQFMAASYAGMVMAMSWAQPLTYKRPTGWTGVGVVQDEGEKNLESQNGLAVVEVTRRLQIRMRHGVTTDPTDLLHREWSIIGQQDAMVYRLRDYLDAAGLIGQPIYPFTLVNVKSTVEAALQSLIRDGLIVDYQGLKVRQLLTNPDVLEASFGWLPAMPLNYIVCTFAIDLTTGDTRTQGNTGNVANITNAGQVTATTSGTITAPTSSSVNDFGGSANTLRSTI